MDRVKIGYFRVSKEDETEQDLGVQVDAVLEKFDIDKNDIVIYKERGSAYNLDKIGKRGEFLALISKLFDVNSITLADIFLSNYKKKKIDLYIWDYSRIMRNMEFCLLFGLLCDFFDIHIYSHKQGLIGKQDNDTPNDKLVKYLMYSISSYSGEEYSYNISTNIKKVVKKQGNITKSTYNNKWGKHFKRPSGEKVKLSVNDVESMNKAIIKLIKKDSEWGSYSKIIKIIEKKFNINVSRAYLTKVKQNNNL